MTSPTVQVGKRLIGAGAACFVIAEAGSNHNGSLEQAKRLIDLAASAGADAVKFQFFRAHKLYPKSAGSSDYLKDSRSIYDLIAQMEMPEEWLPLLAQHCATQGILFMASVFDEGSVDLCDPYVLIHKIASYEMTHFPLIRHVARTGKPVIVSTGAAQMGEVSEMVEVFRQTGNDRLLLMQCTAAYPAPLETLNLRALKILQATFELPVGLSDHSRDPIVGPMAAVALGADLLEKHFTLSNRLPGPDHPFALEPNELAEMIQRIRQVEKALGAGQKEVQAVEKELRDFARRHLFAVRDISLGEAFTRENVAVLRKGKLPAGLEPKHYEELLGRKACRPVSAEAAIQREDCA